MRKRVLQDMRHWRGVDPIRLARTFASNEHPHWGCGSLEKIQASHLSRARVKRVSAITGLLKLLKFRNGPCNGIGIYKKGERPLPCAMRALRNRKGRNKRWRRWIWISAI